ncbi:type VII secretion system-associated protein [Streptomyces sp. NPDC088788]|uniref:type VII secretion system-associated protein n=1 Tax=Streptomyces sp. NPDC088788 TaxID=3365898 RepID=UPI003800B9EF
MTPTGRSLRPMSPSPVRGRGERRVTRGILVPGADRIPPLVLRMQHTDGVVPMTDPCGKSFQEPDSAPEADAVGGPARREARPSGVQGGPSSVLKGHAGFREPPEDFAKAAKVAPEHWLSVVDRHWDGDEGEPPPSWASLGRWRSDVNGDIVEWEVNTAYRPSPDAHGWAPPVSPLDAAVQLVATGYASEGVFALMIADAELAVCVDVDGGLAVMEASDGTYAVPVFPTSPELDQDRLPPHEVMFLPDLLELLADGKEVLVLSSSAPVGQLVSVRALLAARAELEEFAAREADAWPPASVAVGIADSGLIP